MELHRGNPSSGGPLLRAKGVGRSPGTEGREAPEAEGLPARRSDGADRDRRAAGAGQGLPRSRRGEPGRSVGRAPHPGRADGARPSEAGIRRGAPHDLRALPRPCLRQHHSAVSAEDEGRLPAQGLRFSVRALLLLPRGPRTGGPGPGDFRRAREVAEPPADQPTDALLPGHGEGEDASGARDPGAVLRAQRADHRCTGCRSRGLHHSLGGSVSVLSASACRHRARSSKSSGRGSASSATEPGV